MPQMQAHAGLQIYTGRDVFAVRRRCPSSPHPHTLRRKSTLAMRIVRRMALSILRHLVIFGNAIPFAVKYEQLRHSKRLEAAGFDAELYSQPGRLGEERRSPGNILYPPCFWERQRHTSGRYSTSWSLTVVLPSELPLPPRLSMAEWYCEAPVFGRLLITNESGWTKFSGNAINFCRLVRKSKKFGSFWSQVIR